MAKLKAEDKQTIESVVQDGLCTGCGSCVGICPNGTVEMVIDHRKGIYVPKLDKEKCTECGLCFEVCPGHSVDFKQLNRGIFGKEPEDILLGNYLNCYIGHATDYDTRYNSASGGLVTTLLIFALDQGIIDGALVTKMKKDKPLEPEPFIARTREEIISASKSKYCPVPANVALRGILEAKKGEKIAVVGLPCHIQGIRKAEVVNEKLKNRVVMHLGIFCSRTCSFLGTEFLLTRLGFNKDEVKQLNYRGEGWPGSMSIQLKNNEKISVPLSYYWDDKFTAFTQHRCVLCSEAAAELADISLGDAWGLSDDRIGKSVIISRNTLGENVLQRMLSRQDIEIAQIDARKIVQGSITYKKNVKARFWVFKLGRKLPTYNQDLLKPKLIAYLAAVLLLLRMFLASKRHLWGLLDIYVRIFVQLLKYATRIKSGLRL